MQCSTHCRPSLLLPTLLSLCFVKSINSRGRLGPAKSAFDNLIWVLPRIWCNSRRLGDRCEVKRRVWKDASAQERRSEEHTSELQSLAYLVCRLLLEKKKTAHARYVS